jgi:hypothetical protein
MNNFIKNIENNDFKYLTKLIFKNVNNIKDVDNNKNIIINNIFNMGAFLGCTSLKKIIINNNITHIHNSAFHNCKGIEKIIIPSSVIHIDSFAFSNCSGLEKLIIPNSVTQINISAFENCTGLKEIIIPNDYRMVIKYIFYNVDLSNVNITYT